MVRVHCLVGKTGELIGHCNKLDGGEQGARETPKREVLCRLGDQGGFLEEAT